MQNQITKKRSDPLNMNNHFKQSTPNPKDPRKRKARKMVERAQLRKQVVL
jgi:hypothetical protein